MLFFGFMLCFCAISVVPLTWQCIQHPCQPFALGISLHVRRGTATLYTWEYLFAGNIHSTSSAPPIALHACGRFGVHLHAMRHYRPLRWITRLRCAPAPARCHSPSARYSPDCSPVNFTGLLYSLKWRRVGGAAHVPVHAAISNICSIL